jgi:YbbR domain-containing protein
LPITQQGGYRDLAVKVNVAGQVANGYRLSNITVSPPVVTVFSSNADLVNNLPGVVDTTPLDLQNAKSDISTRIALNLPPGVTLVGEQEVLIRAGIVPIESSLTLSGEKVEVIGLPAGYEAQISPLTVDVIVSGPLPVLDALTRQDVKVTVDLKDLQAGSHQLTPTVTALVDDVLVQSVLPATIEVIIKPIATSTP